MKGRRLAVWLALAAACGVTPVAAQSSHERANTAPGAGPVEKVVTAVERGANAAASGVARGAKAAARGVERGASAAAGGIQRGASAAARGVKKGVEAGARGVEKGAAATARAAGTVAGKVKPAPAAPKPAASGS